MSRLCFQEENCRGGTEVSVKITCDVAENMSCWQRRLCGQIVETKKSGEERSGGVEWSDHSGRDRVLTISGRRTLYG